MCHSISSLVINTYKGDKYMITSDSILNCALSNLNIAVLGYRKHSFDDKLFVDGILEFIEKFKEYGKFSICKAKIDNKLYHILKYEVDENSGFKIYRSITPYLTDGIHKIFKEEIKSRGFIYGCLRFVVFDPLDNTMKEVCPELYSLITEHEYNLLSEVCGTFEMFDELENEIRNTK